MKNVLLATTASLALFALAACSQEETTDPAAGPDEQSQAEPLPQNTEETAATTEQPTLADDVAQTVGETLQPVAEAAQDLTQGLTEELSNAAEPVGEFAAQVADSVDNAVADAAVAISDTVATQGENAGALGTNVVEMVGQAADQIASIAGTDDPLTANSWGYAGTDAVVVSFSDGSVSGNAGCNAFTGSYTDDGSGNIEVGPLVSTKMLCEEAIMMIEREIMTGIGTAVGYTIEETALVLTDVDGNALTLEAQLLN